jgi:hypothetical protein
LAHEYNSKAIQLTQLHNHVKELFDQLPTVILTLVFGYLWLGPVRIPALLKAIRMRSSELFVTGKVLNNEVLQLFQVYKHHDVLDIFLLPSTVIYCYMYRSRVRHTLP